MTRYGITGCLHSTLCTSSELEAGQRSSSRCHVPPEPCNYSRPKSKLALRCHTPVFLYHYNFELKKMQTLNIKNRAAFGSSRVAQRQCSRVARSSGRTAFRPQAAIKLYTNPGSRGKITEW